MKEHKAVSADAVGERTPEETAHHFHDDKRETPRTDALWDSDDCHSLEKWFELSTKLERELAQAEHDAMRWRQYQFERAGSTPSARTDIEGDAARYRKLRTQAYRTSDLEPPHWCIPETCGLGADIDDAIDKLSYVVEKPRG